jgi:hypothetical protein
MAEVLNGYVANQSHTPTLTSNPTLNPNSNPNPNPNQINTKIQKETTLKLIKLRNVSLVDGNK